MADIHVLSGNGIDKWTLIFHFAVPNVNNAVSVNYRTALVNSGLGGTTSMASGAGPGQMSGAELILIEAGELFEHSVSFPIESGSTDNAEMLAVSRQIYARDETRMIERLQRKLKYFGFSGSKE